MSINPHTIATSVAIVLRIKSDKCNFADWNAGAASANSLFNFPPCRRRRRFCFNPRINRRAVVVCRSSEYILHELVFNLITRLKQNTLSLFLLLYAAPSRYSCSVQDKESRCTFLFLYPTGYVISRITTFPFQKLIFVSSASYFINSSVKFYSETVVKRNIYEIIF